MRTAWSREVLYVYDGRGELGCGAGGPAVDRQSLLDRSGGCEGMRAWEEGLLLGDKRGKHQPRGKK